MIKTQDIIDELDLIERERFEPMLRQICIPDFYKCIAQFAGLDITAVNDDVIISYLLTWCRNKYRFFKMLGDKVRLDQHFVYERPDTDMGSQFKDLARQYPAYYFWLNLCQNQTKNKIGRLDGYGREGQLKDAVKDIFPQYSLEGSMLTHFFKSKLNAPDELVTALGRLFENDKVEANHTISIDPVDMMLASENPYDWNSCYRLELDRTDSHADGCLAAILDDTSLITYVWEHEGKYNLYDNFKFKNIRYYRMRGWIAISEDFAAIHFNSIYPGRRDYDDAFIKQFREIVETVVSNHKGFANIWRKNDYVEIDDGHPEASYYFRRHDYIYRFDRQYYYGYNEYDNEYVYINSEVVGEKRDTMTREEFNKIHKEVYVFNTKILCPCGCGAELLGSGEVGEEDDDEYEYNGEGFRAENFYERERYWCDYKDDYCDCECCEDNCEDCWYWEDAHPRCDIDEDYECEEHVDVYDGLAHSCESFCSKCPRWKSCHEDAEAGEE